MPSRWPETHWKLAGAPLVDVTLAGFDVVWAAAGHPRAVFPTRYDELLRITAGQPVEVD